MRVTPVGESVPTAGFANANANVGFPDGLRMRAPSSTRLASLVYGFAEGLAHQAATQITRRIPGACVWVKTAHQAG
jgi:hypothetical protein